MVKFCPECGSKLEIEYKFCPDCGFNLSKNENKSEESIQEQTNLNSKQDISNKIICDNCGEENEVTNSNCFSCGIKLTNAKFPDAISLIPKKAISQKPNIKKSKKPSSYTKGDAVNPQKKNLNKIKTITIIAIGFGLASIILMFSGVLNSLILPSSEPAKNIDQTSGVDLGNIQKINSLEEVIKNNPKDSKSILELAHLKNDSGMFEQAIVNYKQYLTLVPSDPDARIDMGICYYNLQNYNEAINQMEQALKYDPKHQIGFLDLGIVNLAAGDLNKSKEWLEKAVKLDPNSEYGKKAEELLKSHNNQSNGGN